MEYSSIFNFCSVTSANLTKVYRMKEFFSSFFSSANIIVRAKVNVTRSVSALLPLQGATCTATLYPGRRFACRWAMNFCPFRACPLNAPHRKTDTSTLWGVPVLTSTHTTLRLRKICAICRAKGAICGSPSPRTASVQIREICGKIKTLHCYMLHVTIRWFHMSPSAGRAPTAPDAVPRGRP